ncbi:HipA N-terminal domain-containing protein [Escherichia coli]|uniref:HipA N-terminal domain-containing protein n=1 Tax=Escherichia coli TaxID=562 RepID=UPI00098B1312
MDEHQRVGELTKLANGAHTFKYAPEWLANRYARPLSLSLPLQRGNITSDAYLTSSITCYPIARLYVTGSLTLSCKSRHRLIIVRIGRDSVGAVTLIPEDETVRIR